MAVSDRTILAFTITMAVVSILAFGFVSFELLRDGDEGERPEKEVAVIPAPAHVEDEAFFRNLSADEKEGVVTSRGWELDGGGRVLERSARLTTYGEAMEAMGDEIIPDYPDIDSEAVWYRRDDGGGHAGPPP